MKRNFAILLLLFPMISFSQDLILDNFPSHLQLYPRDQKDSSLVLIAGVATNTEYDSVTLQILKGDQQIYMQTSALVFQDTTASFSFEPKIHAELSEYFFTLFLDTQKVAEADSVVCGDVFLINGQSNALSIDYEDKAHFQSEWFRSFGNSSQVSADCRNDLQWGLAQGNSHFAHAAVGVWGLRLGKLIIENNNVPICILNGATGGSYIADHLRKDSSPTDLNTNYGRLLYRAKKAKIQQSVKAIFWNQGEMNTDNTYAQYADQFSQLYQDWKSDYPELEKVFIFQIRPCQGERSNILLREIQREIAEQYPDVEIMSTAGICGHDGLHYNYEGYNQMALWIYRLAAKYFYNSSDTLFIAPPKIKSAEIIDGEIPKIKLSFDQTVIWPADTLGAKMKDNFFLVGDNVTKIDSGYAADNTIFLLLSSGTSATGVSYVPNKYYPGTHTIYEGPWVRNPRSVSALTFYNYPLTMTDVADRMPSKIITKTAVLETNYPNPFNGMTQIRYQITTSGHVKIAIFNSKGQFIKILRDSEQQAGNYSIAWKPDGLSSGIYLCHLTFEKRLTVTQKLLYLK